MEGLVVNLPSPPTYCETPLAFLPAYCREKNCPIGLPAFRICRVLPDCPPPSGSASRTESPPVNKGLVRLVILFTLWDRLRELVQLKSAFFTRLAARLNSIPLL